MGFCHVLYSQNLTNLQCHTGIVTECSRFDDQQTSTKRPPKVQQRITVHSCQKYTSILALPCTRQALKLFNLILKLVSRLLIYCFFPNAIKNYFLVRKQVRPTSARMPSCHSYCQINNTP